MHALREKGHLALLKTETALNFTSSFRSYRRVNTICLGRKNRSLKAVYISNRCFISDSYKTQTHTLWRQDILFLKAKRGIEKVITKLYIFNFEIRLSSDVYTESLHFRVI